MTTGGSTSTERAGSPRRGRARAKTDDATTTADSRQRVVKAAIECILEQGFYRASSNAIAERAGLTWGVIQYYFGTREKLMVAVLQEGGKRLSEMLHDAEIVGTSVRERVEQFFDILDAYYGSPDYLAFIQVLVNLSHDPRTSEQTRQTMAEVSEFANPELNRLVSRVFSGTGIRRKDIRSLLFHALRGLSLSHVMLTTAEPFSHNIPHQDLAERRLLAKALSLLIDQESNRPG
ncbi:MAG TPA: TetR/AcrR family transcriptional regulator [Pseudonocardiaceae bacterium]|jgi:AcrR family transcriptional regulator|nr:TetR/AcrR family transcriptional regulator [Pseudonocardiaceae bacterium]